MTYDFTATNDEVVLMKLLEVVMHCLRCATASLLLACNVWALAQTCFKLSRQPRASALLRSTAESTLTHVVLTVFNRADIPLAFPTHNTDSNKGTGRSIEQQQQQESEDEWGGQLESSTDEESGGGTASTDQDLGGTGQGSLTSSPTQSTMSGNSVGGDVVMVTSPAPSISLGGMRAVQGGQDSNTEEKSMVNMEWGEEEVDLDSLGVLERFMAFLIDLIDPNRTGGTGLSGMLPVPAGGFKPSSGPPTEEQKAALVPDVILGLTLINTVLETVDSASLTQRPRLVAMMQDHLCKFLLQNSQTDELQVLMLTLRVVFNLFNSMKQHLKVQLEVFFTSVHLRIACTDSRTGIDASTAANTAGANAGAASAADAGFPPEQRELALESLLEFCREPALMVDLYINYDCDPQCTNLFETLCKSLVQNVCPRGWDLGLPAAGTPLAASKERERATSVAQYRGRLHGSGGEGGGGSGLNILHVLALEAVLAIVHSISSRCFLPEHRQQQQLAHASAMAMGGGGGRTRAGSFIGHTGGVGGGGGSTPGGPPSSFLGGMALADLAVLQEAGGEGGIGDISGIGGGGNDDTGSLPSGSPAVGRDMSMPSLAGGRSVSTSAVGMSVNLNANMALHTSNVQRNMDGVHTGSGALSLSSRSDSDSDSENYGGATTPGTHGIV